jgi:hypothetical protein
MSSVQSIDAFTPADDLERWVASQRGVPISQLLRGDVHAGSTASPRVQAAVARDEVRYLADFSDIDERIAALGLQPLNFARCVTRRMGWEHDGARGRGKCHQAQLVLANLRTGRPIAYSELMAVKELLGTAPSVLRDWIDQILGQSSDRCDIRARRRSR